MGSEIKAVHKPCGFCLVITSPYFPRREEIYRQKHRGENVASKFIKVLRDETSRCKQLINEESHEPIKMTAEEEQDFEEADTCWICGEKGFKETKGSVPPKKKAKQNNHLKELEPYLVECEMDKRRIPSMAEVNK